MNTGSPLTPLINQLKKLPGIGEKSAQRLAFVFLSWPQETVQSFAETLVQTKRSIKYCNTCYNISLTEQCNICQNPKRNGNTLCIVADPRDIFAIERTQSYFGRYHVLGGLLSPIEGITPELLRIDELINRVQEQPPTELILAINPTIEGEATILYLCQLLERHPIKLTKLAYGLPIGSDMDYADDMTLQRAFMGRNELKEPAL